MQLLKFLWKIPKAESLKFAYEKSIERSREIAFSNTIGYTKYGNTIAITQTYKTIKKKTDKFTREIEFQKDLNRDNYAFLALNVKKYDDDPIKNMIDLMCDTISKTTIRGEEEFRKQIIIDMICENNDVTILYVDKKSYIQLMSHPKNILSDIDGQVQLLIDDTFKLSDLPSFSSIESRDIVDVCKVYGIDYFEENYTRLFKPLSCDTTFKQILNAYIQSRGFINTGFMHKKDILGMQICKCAQHTFKYKAISKDDNILIMLNNVLKNFLLAGAEAVILSKNETSVV